MKRTIGVLLVALVAAAALVYAPTASAADDKYMTVAWQLPAGYTGTPTSTDPAIWPQTLVVKKTTDDKDLNAVDALIPGTCGLHFQVDVYRYKTAADRAKVDEILSDNILTGGAEDGPVNEGWKFLSNAPCVTPPNFIETSHVLSCGAVDITLRNVSSWIYPVSVEIDGVHSYGPVVDNRTGGRLDGPQKDQSATRTITFPEDHNGGTATVRYRVDAGTENKLYKGLPVGEWTELTVDTDCLDPQPPAKTRTDVAESVDCTTELVTITTTKFETPFVLDNGTWVPGTEVQVGAPVVTTRPATNAELDAFPCPSPPKPKPEIDIKVTESVDCTTELVTITTTTTTVDWTLVGRTWVKQAPVVTMDFVDRPATAAELNLADCPKPPEPPTKVDTTPWVDGTYGCDDTTVTQTRTVATTTFTYDTATRTWVPSTSTATETRTRTLSAIEQYPCPKPPPTTVPPTTEPPTTTVPEPELPDEEPPVVTVPETPEPPQPTPEAPPATPTPNAPDKLPVTGSNIWSVAAVGLCFIIVGSTLWAINKPRPARVRTR